MNAWKRSACRCAAAVAAVIFLCLRATAQQADVKVEQVAEGLGFPEGPLWHPDGFLLFSDMHTSTIQRLLPQGGSVPWFDKGKRTNGLTWNNDHTRILACCNSDRELLEIDPVTKDFRVLAKKAPMPFNDVNDLAVTPDGYVLFTDPKWGAKSGDVQGVYRWSPKDKITTLAAELDRQPNGIVISPDKRWVYVDRNGANDIWRFRLGEEGKLSDGSVWCNAEQGAGPDGMTVDKRGYVYMAQAGNGKISVIGPEGKIVQQIPVSSRMTTNCEFQGNNDLVLYVTGGGGRPTEKKGTVHKLTFTKLSGS